MAKNNNNLTKQNVMHILFGVALYLPFLLLILQKSSLEYQNLQDYTIISAIVAIGLFLYLYSHHKHTQKKKRWWWQKKDKEQYGRNTVIYFAMFFGSLFLIHLLVN